jgi:CRISPR-associated Csh1 family protein
MINHFKAIGKTILDNQGYYNTQDDTARKKAFLMFHTLRPYEKREGITHAIGLSFDFEKQEFRFLLDKELSESNRDYFFAFKVGAPNDAKKFLATNNIESFINSTFTESLAYLEEKRNDKRSKSWFDTYVPIEYDSLLKTILEKFYVKEDNGFILDETRMAADQFKTYSRIKERLQEKQKNKKVPVEKVYNTFLIEIYGDSDHKNLSSIFLVKLDNRHILEHENPKILRAYINLAYYDLYQRYITEGIIKEKHCHVCGEEKDVMGKFPFPMKYYGTTNPLYFENLKNKNSYRSFSICPTCMTDVLAGMKYTENHLREYMFGMSCYLIPALSEEDRFFEEKLKAAAAVLEKRGSKYSSDILYLEKLLKQSEKKKIRSFSFNILFYFSEKQAFNILRYISHIELRDLMIKMKLFDQFTDRYDLHLIGEYGNSLTLADLRYALFPSNRSHPNPDYKVYGKELLNFLENFLNNHKISYYELISQFTAIYKRLFHRKNSDRLSPFKMVGFLTLLHQINLLKEDNGMSDGHSISEIIKQEYKDFFNTHTAVYGKSSYRQGLFLLGTVISRIASAQRKKGEGRKDSSTFLAKINYDGIPARRVDKLVNEVKKYAIIYDVFKDPGIWGNITDRLQGIDTSILKPDEVVFYILSGISFQDYLGMKSALDKKLSGNGQDKAPENEQGEQNGE